MRHTFSVKNNSHRNIELVTDSRSVLLAAVVVVGISSIVTQIVLLREFLSVFYGNELVIGIVMANWMIVTAIGTFLGRYAERVQNRLGLLTVLIILLGIIPSITVFLIRFLRNSVLEIGVMPDLLQIILFSLFFIAPYCILSGFSFNVIAVLISEEKKENRIPEAYSWEAVGSVLGGLAFSIGFLYSIQTFERLFILIVVTLIAAYFISLQSQGTVAKIFILSIALLLLIFGRGINIEEITMGFVMPGQKILYHNDTPYGSLTVTEQDNQYNFFENNVLLFSTQDPASNEEAVHYTMLQHPDPRDVLLVSGGISGTTRVILKYNVEKIDYVELNPAIFELGEKFTDNLKDPRIHIISQDGRLFVRSTSSNYDIVLINLPDPVTAQINRYYTAEFYSDVKKILKKGGVLGMSLSSSADYMNKDARLMRSILYSTLKENFLNILIIPGMRDFFIASDLVLDIRISERVVSRRLDNIYVNPYYINDKLLTRRSRGIEDLIWKDELRNLDFKPISYYRQLILWLESFDINYGILILIFTVLVIFSLARTNTISYGMYTAGFAGSGIEIVLLLAFQILYGYVYQMMGILIAMFMAGLASGALMRKKIISNVNIKTYMYTQVVLAVVIAFVPVILYLLQVTVVSSVVTTIAFILTTFLIACIVGFEFSTATELDQGSYSSIASRIYGFDLIGSAVGALLVSAFLIPLAGIIPVCFLIALIVFSSAVLSFVHRGKYNLS